MLLPVERSYADFWAEMAVREIQKSYGHTVDIPNKAKSLVKFGRTYGADADVRTTVALFQDTGVINETFVTTNAITHMASEDTGDTEQTIVLEGQTIDADGNLTFVVQNVGPLTGTTAVAFSVPCARATRAYVKDGTFSSPAVPLSGNVNIFEGDTGVVGGKKTTSSKTHLTIEGVAGTYQSEKAATSISSLDYWILTGITCAMQKDGGATAAVEFDIDVRHLGGVWRELGLEVSLRTTANVMHAETFTPYIVVPPNSDVRLVATSNVAGLKCTGRIRGILAKILY